MLLCIQESSFTNIDLVTKASEKGFWSPNQFTMKNLINLCITCVVIIMTSCHNEQQETKAEVPVPALKQTVAIAPKAIVNNYLDSMLTLMIDTARNYFPAMYGYTIDWRNVSDYKTDSVGNRIIEIRADIKGGLREMVGISYDTI